MARETISKKPSSSGGSQQARSAKKTAAVCAYDKAPSDFTQTFYANVPAIDIASFSANDRDCIAASMWHLARQRKKGELKLRLFNPSPATDGWTVDHTILETVNEDMPFLVDSLTGAIQRLGLTVHLVVHPVVQIVRDAQGKLINMAKKGGLGQVIQESFIHIQLDHCLDPEMLKQIETDMRAVLADVRAAVEDWQKMRQRMDECVTLATASIHEETANENTAETREFLHWMEDKNFIFLGYRDIDLGEENGKLAHIKIVPNSGLGVLRNPELRMFGGLRDKSAKNNQLYHYARQNQLLMISKTNALSRVHRSVPMDAIFVRRFNEEGEVIGERLFVGLFTSRSYSQNPHEIPFLRKKIEHVQKRAGFPPGGHDDKALAHILNNYPHDELLQISEDELLQNSLGILQLQDRARVALMVRRDPFERFVTCLIYVPRDRYDSELRIHMQHFLETAFAGKAEDWTVRIDDSLLARAFITIHLTAESPHPDLNKLEDDLREMCRGWTDRLRDSLVEEYGEATALALLRRYGKAFPAAYRDAIIPAKAIYDIHSLERSKTLSPEKLIIDLSAPDASGLMRLKLFQIEKPIALTTVLPLIENMGLKIEFMNGPYEIQPQNGDKTVFIHEFAGRPAFAPIVEFHHIKPAFEEALGRVWTCDAENDLFNSLTLRAGMSWREVLVMRALARYLRQLRIPYSHEMIAETFLHHPQAAQQIYALFFARHNPDLKGDRTARCREIEQRLGEALTEINTLEDDRIVRRYLNLVQSSLRTNFFQLGKDGQPKSYLSIKFDSRAVEFMPLPKPLYEIFVYGPRTEAVHLRGGKVARGGIRWSDRRDDFRNEILGLMKAQMVKNSVIVPVGSKGGFIVKRPPAEADKYQAEGIACYRIMMCGLLDITDNRVGNKIVPPERVVRHDGDDPYLVVAADKGTAKFSDIANEISQSYGFWLDDAFASGGSAGYDHKGMAITARGAWEAVKRHFRELGKNIQTTDFTCIGVGDMSGDVFGNGMLLSKHIRLLGAFDHRHIFCDPNPDSGSSYAERERMFKLSRSSWADYDKKKISKGGGVFSRSEKTIKLSPEMKKTYGVVADSLSPTDLIQAMLRAEAELLYFGGIGTFIKASDESNESVGDRATEPMRIDAHEVRAKVIGEGANLGVTQRGRIEFALKGGHINTDAIDNSAGVDTSDHEVNIKILLRKAVTKGTLSLEARNKLLASMTDDVAKLVLRDNYLQTQALSVAEARSVDFLPMHERVMHLLEKSGLLNRAVEFLPDASEIAERKRMGKGLTRPELAVLLSYSKIWLYSQLLESNLPDEEAFQGDLLYYFPEQLRKKYGDDIMQHQLKREIVATAFANSIINRLGNSFVLVMSDRTGKSPSEISRAYLLTREAFNLRDTWHAIEALDNVVSAKMQISMFIDANSAASKAVYWILTNDQRSSKLAPTLAAYSKGVMKLTDWLEKNAGSFNDRFKKKHQELTSGGVPAGLARRIAFMPVLPMALDLTELSSNTGCSIEEAAEIFFGLGQRLGFDWLTDHARLIASQTPWQREAVATVTDEITASQREITASILAKNGRKNGKSLPTGQKMKTWLERHATRLERYESLLNEWRSTETVDIAVLTLASRQLAALLK